MKYLIKSNMKKHIRHFIYILAMFLSVNICYAQDADTVINPVSYINIVGRYTEGKGVEIRFFPDKKSVLEVGFKEGFTIERALFDSTLMKKKTDTLKYSEIARIFPYK